MGGGLQKRPHDTTPLHRQSRQQHKMTPVPNDSRTPPVWIVFGNGLAFLGFMVAFKVLLEGDPLLPDAAIGCVLMIIGVLIRVLISRAR